MNYLVLFVRFLLKHKYKIVLTALFSIVFIFMLFPMNDLNDLVTTQISKLTNRQIYLSFEEMSLSPFGPKLTLGKVSLETPSTPTANVAEFTATPSFSSLITKQPAGTINARGIMSAPNSELHIEVKSASKSESGLPRTRIDAQGKGIALKDVRELASLPMTLQGELNLNSTAIADLTFTEQPELELNLTINKFDMPSSSIMLADLGRVNLPQIKLGIIELKGKLEKGRFTIESGKVGTPKDELHGDVKGSLGLTFMNQNGRPVPIVGSYNIDLNLLASAPFKERAKFFLSFLDGYKTELAEGTRYKFKIQASSAQMPPQFTPLR